MDWEKLDGRCTEQECSGPRPRKVIKIKDKDIFYLL